MAKKKEKNLLKEIAEEVDTFDNMLSALVELLEEKGILTQKDWEDRVEQKLLKAKKTVSYRDIQFSDK